jgi:hypothetical protein
VDSPSRCASCTASLSTATRYSTRDTRHPSYSRSRRSRAGEQGHSAPQALHRHNGRIGRCGRGGSVRVTSDRPARATPAPTLGDRPAPPAAERRRGPSPTEDCPRPPRQPLPPLGPAGRTLPPGAGIDADRPARRSCLGWNGYPAGSCGGREGGDAGRSIARPGRVRLPRARAEGARPGAASGKPSTDPAFALARRAGPGPASEIVHRAEWCGRRRTESRPALQVSGPGWRSCGRRGRWRRMGGGHAHQREDTDAVRNGRADLDPGRIAGYRASPGSWALRSPRNPAGGCSACRHGPIPVRTGTERVGTVSRIWERIRPAPHPPRAVTSTGDDSGRDTGG